MLPGDGRAWCWTCRSPHDGGSPITGTVRVEYIVDAAGASPRLPLSGRPRRISYPTVSLDTRAGQPDAAALSVRSADPDSARRLVLRAHRGRPRRRDRRRRTRPGPVGHRTSTCRPVSARLDLRTCLHGEGPDGAWASAMSRCATSISFLKYDRGRDGNPIHCAASRKPMPGAARRPAAACAISSIAAATPMPPGGACSTASCRTSPARAANG